VLLFHVGYLLEQRDDLAPFNVGMALMVEELLEGIAVTAAELVGHVRDSIRRFRRTARDYRAPE
jgi:hypothetical protein